MKGIALTPLPWPTPPASATMPSGPPSSPPLSSPPPALLRRLLRRRSSTVSPPTSSPCFLPTSERDVSLDFDNVSLLASNLGGLEHDTMPRVMHFGGMTTLRDGRVVDLEVSNQTMYAAQSAWFNGLSVKTGGTFGMINLKAPNEEVPTNFVQLQFRFLDGATGLPLTLDRTQMTFYDFDQSESGTRECLQVKGSVVDTRVAVGTQLEMLDTALAADMLPAGLDTWEGGVNGTSASSPSPGRLHLHTPRCWRLAGSFLART